MAKTPDIADVRLADDTGAEVRVGDLWAEQPTAVVFLRHFGCTFCREHVAEIQPRLLEVREAGGDVAAIGMGTPAHAAAFRELSGIEFPLLVAEDTSVHEAAGLTRGNWLRVTGPQVWPRIAKGLLGGHGVKLTAADMSQLGGTFVYDTDGSLLWAQRAKTSADNASVDDIVAAVVSATHQL